MLYELTGLQGQFTHTYAMLEGGRLFPEGMAERWHHDHLIAQRYGALHERHMPVMHRVKTSTVNRITTHAHISRAAHKRCDCRGCGKAASKLFCADGLLWR